MGEKTKKMTWLLHHTPTQKKAEAAPKKRASTIVFIIYRVMPLPVTEQGLVLSNRANSEPVVAVVVVHAVVVRAEGEVPRDVRVVRVERTRPKGAAEANVVELIEPTVASRRQEETVAVACREETTVHTTLLRPGHGRVVVEFLPFLPCGHAPAAAPVGRGGIILGQQSGQVVGETVVSIVGIATVLGELRILIRGAVCIQVGAPVIIVLRLRLAPGEIVAVVLRSIGAHIAGGSQEAARQAEVDIFVLSHFNRLEALYRVAHHLGRVALRVRYLAHHGLAVVDLHDDAMVQHTHRQYGIEIRNLIRRQGHIAGQGNQVVAAFAVGRCSQFRVLAVHLKLAVQLLALNAHHGDAAHMRVAIQAHAQAAAEVLEVQVIIIAVGQHGIRTIGEGAGLGEVLHRRHLENDHVCIIHRGRVRIDCRERRHHVEFVCIGEGAVGGVGALLQGEHCALAVAVVNTDLVASLPFDLALAVDGVKIGPVLRPRLDGGVEHCLVRVVLVLVARDEHHHAHHKCQYECRKFSHCRVLLCLRPTNIDHVHGFRSAARVGCDAARGTQHALGLDLYDLHLGSLIAFFSCFHLHLDLRFKDLIIHKPNKRSVRCVISHRT